MFGKIPQGPVEMILACGLIGLMVLAWAPVLMAMFIAAVIARKDRLSFVFLCLSFAPFLTGMIGTFSGMIGAFGEVATNPQASPADLAAGVYVALFPNLMGSMISLLSVFAACFVLAFSKGETAKAEKPCA